MLDSFLLATTAVVLVMDPEVPRAQLSLLFRELRMSPPLHLQLLVHQSPLSPLWLVEREKVLQLFLMLFAYMNTYTYTPRWAM
jgi:hypothetical protein